jgi:hypothetical protein
MAGKYWIRRRAIELAAVNPYRQRQLRYGKWVTIAVATTEDEAKQKLRELRKGLYDWAIFFHAKRLEVI